MEDDLHGIIDIKDRRRIQNRLSQRKRRERLRQKELKDFPELGCADDGASSIASSCAASDLDQALVGGPKMSIDTATVPELLDHYAVFPNERFLDLNTDGAFLSPTQINDPTEAPRRLTRRDVPRVRASFTLNDDSAGEQFDWKKTNNKSTRRADLGERSLSILKLKADRIIDQVLSMYRFSIQLEIAEEDPSIVDIMERVRVRFHELRPFPPSLEEE